MRPPAFWSAPRPGLLARLLQPAAAAYGAIAAARMDQPGSRTSVPVVCVGNLTLGGAGKTPTALALAALAAGQGLRPVFLTRGYGGRLAGPVVVDPRVHTAADVGDEALLLARAATTIVARDRGAALPLLAAIAPDLAIMDDGLQNPSLIKDFALAVVDAEAGLGNGLVFPAGPLRAPLARQLPHVDAIVLLGPAAGSAPIASAAAIAARAAAAGRPVLHAVLRRRADAAPPGGRVLAYAGIGRPQKFFDQLRRDGADVVRTAAFADHHRYTTAEAAALLAAADGQGLALITTEKDLARLSAKAAGTLAELARRSVAYGVECVFLDVPAVCAFLLRVA